MIPNVPSAIAVSNDWSPMRSSRSTASPSTRCARAWMNPPGAGTKSSCNPPAAPSTYRTFCRAMSRSDNHGVTTASVIIPTSRIPCPVIVPTRLKNPSSRLPRNTSPVMCFVGGIHFNGASGNNSRASNACASSNRNDSGTSGLISNACPSPSCQSASPASCAKNSFSNCDTVTVCASSTASAVVR